MQLKTGDIITFNLQKDYISSKVVKESELLEGDLWIQGGDRAYFVLPSSDRLIYINREDTSSNVWKVVGIYPIANNARTLNRWVEVSVDNWKFYRKNRVKKIYAKELE